MTNLFRRKYRTPAPQLGRRLLVAVTLVVIGLSAVDFLLGGLLRTNARAVVAPIESALSAASYSLMQKEFWAGRASLLSQIESLKTQVSDLETRAAAYEFEKLENEILRQMARLAETEEGITAPIVSSFRSSPYGTFLIGAGREEGVVAGNLVLSSGGFVLGRVTDVSARTATVQTIFAPGSSIEVAVQSVAFTLDGRGGGNARAEVPREAELHEKDAVVAPSLGGRTVGLIGKIESASSSVYSDVHVVFPINLNSIRFVYVVPGVF